MPGFSSNDVDTGQHSINDSSALRVELSDPDGVKKYPQIQLSRWRDSFDIRGWGAVSRDDLTCDSFFIDAEKFGVPIYVPPGKWRLSTPMILDPKARYYGPGILVFDNAEWWRRGGSSGDENIAERYTLFYEYNAKNDVSITFDGKSVPYIWIDERTIQAPGSKPDVAVRINIKNGFLRLGPIAESIRSFNVFGTAASGSSINPVLIKAGQVPIGYDNTSFGSRALLSVEHGSNNTAFGSKCLLSNKLGDNNTAVGFQALYRAVNILNTAVGSISGEWLTKGSHNSLYGASSGKKLTVGSFNVAVGFDAMGESSGTNYSVAIGYRANANTDDKSQNNSVYIGAFAGDYNIGSNNTFVGYRAGNCIDAAKKIGAGTGHDNVGLGMFALKRNLEGSENAVLGAGAAASSSRVQATVAIGYGAAGASPSVGDYSTAVGHSSLFNSEGGHNAALGYQALFNTIKGQGNVAIGNHALLNNISGDNNTSIGFNSGRISISGDKTVQFNNSTTIGNDSKVSDSNQVQLGNSSTTTYVYGTVQNRSDARDKADIRDTELGIEFILGLRAVDGRWDLRDDYIETIEKKRKVAIPLNGSEGPISREEKYIDKVIRHTPDGTHKRKRFHHWFIAQEVQKLCDSLNVEFGGLQHHQVNGGEDVYTLGYDEFIPPVVKAVQSCWKRMDEIESRLKVLEEKQ